MHSSAASTDARRSLKRQEEASAAKLEQVLSLFRGDLLDGEPVNDWHLEHRDRLQRMYVDALMELGARHLEEERHDESGRRLPACARARRAA